MAEDWLLKRQREQDDMTRRARGARVQQTLMGFVGYALIVGVGATGIFIWDAQDASGRLPHEITTKITAKSDWFEGQNKPCLSRGPDFFAEVQCDDGEVRTISVKFWGRRAQDGAVTAYWTCMRISSGFECRQTGASSAMVPIDPPVGNVPGLPPGWH